MNIITGENVTTTQPDETVSLHVAKAAIAMLGKDDKFTDDDVRDTPELEDYALAYIREYTGDFEFMVSMQHDYGKYGELSLPKVRGVLNCLLAQMRYEARNQKPPQPLFDELGNDLPLVVEQVIQPATIKTGRYCTINPDTDKRHFYRVDVPEDGKWVGDIVNKRSRKRKEFRRSKKRLVWDILYRHYDKKNLQFRQP